MSLRLNLGADNKRIEGFINVDLASNADVQCDVRELPAEWEGQVEEIIASHIIEHIWPWEVPAMLLGWYRVLKEGGRLIIECPNIRTACMNFINDPENQQMGMWAFYGNAGLQDPLHCHRWGYTPESLSKILATCGFKEIEEKPAQFKQKERRDMRVECVK